MRNSIAIAVLVCCCLNISFAAKANNPVLEDHLINERLTALNSQVDIRLTDLTKKKIEEYVNYKPGAKKLITKSKIYFPVFEEQLRKYNIPEEFKYLPVIESNLRVSIKSRAGAVGLWQFMKRTGQSFGLQIGAEVDERMDVAKSTEAAAQYLLELYTEFEDWTLVLAAYNAGAGGIRKAIRKSGKRSYWEIYDFLPRETRSYVPKFAAAAYLMNFYYDHDIVALVPDSDMTSSIAVKVFHEIDFTTIAQSSGTSMDVIKALNAQYFKEFIPNNTGKYLLRLPAQNMNKFLSNNPFAQVDISALPAGFHKELIQIEKIFQGKDQQVISSTVFNLQLKTSHISSKYQLIKLGKYETLQTLAHKEGISIDKILEINNLNGTADDDFDKFVKVPLSDD